MSKKSRKKLKQCKKRRKILKRETIQTRRTAKNQKAVDAAQQWAQRMNTRAWANKWKSRGE